MKKLFERKEMKYRLNRAQADRLISILSPWLVPDAYPDYEICSVYFDNSQWNLFRKSIDKPVYKEKLRLRSYGIPRSSKDPVFLEIKKKLAGIVYKRRMDLTLEEARAFIRSPQSGTGDVSAMEIENMMISYDLQPRLFVAYHRRAWTWLDDPDLRITLDDSIRWRAERPALEEGDEGELLFDENTYVLEIKSTVNFPIVLIRTLRELGIQPASVSKAGLAYTKMLERGMIHGIS